MEKINFDKFQYMLAPLEDFTDSAFRTLCYNHGCDLTFTEMARVSSLCERNKSTTSKIEIPDETPTVIQLLALNEDNLQKFLKEFVPQKGFSGFNINMGCPSPEIIKLGMGCALMKRITKANNLIKVIKDNGHCASIKMRLGMNQFEKEKKSYLNLINSVDADFFIVHGRHGKQTYKDMSDFTIFLECAKTGKNIIANGDIKTIHDREGLESFGVKGVMVGRAAITNPAIFELLKGKNKDKVAGIDKLQNEYLALADKHYTKEHARKNILKFMGNKHLFSLANK
jgi:tRNA-dihydrouridine synthase